ncbi:MAG: potassium channel family protein [Planctomycetota bacterium]
MDLAGLKAAYQRRRYEVFFWSLLATLAALALRVPDAVGRALFSTSVLVTLEAGPTRRVMVALVVAAWLVMLVAPGASVDLAGMSFLALLGVVITVLILRYALRAKVVGREHIFAGLSGYLLLGLICGQLYWLIEQHAPGSLAVPADTGTFSLPDGVYFSLATLTTVGYGDITPRTELARGLATIEAVTGQIYLAVFVARLIGLYVSRKSAGPS